MLAWLKLLRPTTALLAAIFTIAAFRVAHQPIPWIAVIAIMVLASTAMLTNDWRDRYHDVLKGKVLPVEYPRRFIILLSCAWSISAMLIGFSFLLHGIKIGIVLTIIAVACQMYSETRNIVLLPCTFVALVAASPTLLPVTLGAPVSDILPLFLFAFFVVFGREILKDIEDMGIDRGYKWTFPIAIGRFWSGIIAIATIGVGLVFAARASLLTIPGIGVALLQIIVLSRAGEYKPKISRSTLDIGLAIIMFALIAT